MINGDLKEEERAVMPKGFEHQVNAMRASELHTFKPTRRGRRIQHKNLSYPGWMNWPIARGVINCEIFSPRKPGRKWQLFSAFLGRLADRYADRIVAIKVQFPGSTVKAGRAAAVTGPSTTNSVVALGCNLLWKR